MSGVERVEFGPLESFTPKPNNYYFHSDIVEPVIEALETSILKQPPEVIGSENAIRLSALCATHEIRLGEQSERILAEALAHSPTPVMTQLRQIRDYIPGETYKILLPDHGSFTDVILIDASDEDCVLLFKFEKYHITLKFPLNYPLILSEAEYDQMLNGKRGTGSTHLGKLFHIGAKLAAKDEEMFVAYQNGLRRFGFGVVRPSSVIIGSFAV